MRKSLVESKRGWLRNFKVRLQRENLKCLKFRKKPILFMKLRKAKFRFFKSNFDKLNLYERKSRKIYIKLSFKRLRKLFKKMCNHTRTNFLYTLQNSKQPQFSSSKWVRSEIRCSQNCILWKNSSRRIMNCKAEFKSWHQHEMNCKRNSWSLSRRLKKNVAKLTLSESKRRVLCKNGWHVICSKDRRKILKIDLLRPRLITMKECSCCKESSS